MKLCNKELPDWIKSYATIIGEVHEENNPSELKRLLHNSIPNIFEAYAIILHSFWVDEKPIDWPTMFKKKNKSFDLEAIFSQIRKKTYLFEDLGQSENEVFPGEGDMDEEHLITLENEIQKRYKNEEIEAFYIHLATHNWESDELYQGSVSELNKLKQNKNIRLTPSLIYSKNKNWVVNSDFDLPCSFIGGSQDLIQSLSEKHPKEIYQLKY